MTRQRAASNLERLERTMNATQIQTMAILARKMMLTAAQAVALPATITHAAGKLGFSEDKMVQTCFDNPAVSEYLASICRQVA
jgi:predicted lipoprotein